MRRAIRPSGPGPWTPGLSLRPPVGPNSQRSSRRSASLSSNVLDTADVVIEESSAEWLLRLRGGCRRQVDGTAGLPSAPEMSCAPQAVTFVATFGHCVISVRALSGRSQMTDLQEDRQSRPLGSIRGSPAPFRLGRRSLYSLLRPRRVAPSPPAAWRRASHRALRCGQPACAGR